MTTLDPVMLVELQAALRAGAGAGEAIAGTCRDGALARVAQQVRLGQSLSALASDVDTGDPGADALVRSLALAERTGGAASEAVEHALDAIAAEAALQRTLTARTAQARGTAVILAAIPVVAWTLLVLSDRRTLAFYATPLGILTAGGAIGLAATSWWWMRRMTSAAARAALLADPLTPQPASPRWRRGVTAGMAALAVVTLLLGPVGGVMAAAAATAGFARPPARRARESGHSIPAADPGRGGAADVVDLVAVALAAGLSPATALAEVARMAPPAAVDVMRAAARRAGAGWTTEEAFADGPLVDLGRVLSACSRWGAPAAPALRRLAAELRSRRSAAAEVAAERLQLTLVFPTTLLTLPAFVLGVVPPLLWSTLQR